MSLWNQFEKMGEKSVRTNSSLESWHRLRMRFRQLTNTFSQVWSTSKKNRTQQKQRSACSSLRTGRQKNKEESGEKDQPKTAHMHYLREEETLLEPTDPTRLLVSFSQFQKNVCKSIFSPVRRIILEFSMKPSSSVNTMCNVTDLSYLLIYLWVSSACLNSSMPFSFGLNKTLFQTN